MHTARPPRHRASRDTRAALVSLVTLMSIATAPGCTMPGGGEATEASTIEMQTVVSAYRAYAADDCAEVQRLLEATDLDTWRPAEPRSSFRLLAGFCAERADDLEGARAVYREIVRRASRSFAADDARERLRALRSQVDDPDYDARLEEARARAAHAGTRRVAIERTPATYPPLARLAALEGMAVVEFGVTRAGATDAPIVVDARPPLIFDGAALRAVRSWRYAPAAGETTATRQAIRLRFRPDAPATTGSGDATPSEAQEAPEADGPSALDEAPGADQAP